jgi:hypothetical protein
MTRLVHIYVLSIEWCLSKLRVFGPGFLSTSHYAEYDLSRQGTSLASIAYPCMTNHLVWSRRFCPSITRLAVLSSTPKTEENLRRYRRYLQSYLWMLVSSSKDTWGPSIRSPLLGLHSSGPNRGKPFGRAEPGPRCGQGGLPPTVVERKPWRLAGGSWTWLLGLTRSLARGVDCTAVEFWARFRDSAALRAVTPAVLDPGT